MPTYQIAVLPGDGIGPEITSATLHVLKQGLARHPEVEVQFTSYSAGADHYRRTGMALPVDVLQQCLAADAVLLAAVGLPDVRKPDGTEVQPDMMMGLRRALGLYAAVRPVKLYPGVKGPLNTAGQGIDMVILRENLEGLFASYGGGCQLNDLVASDTILITREGTERIADYAFQLASRRKGRPLDGRRIVTCVDKANIFRSFAFFRKIFLEVAQRYPDIASDTAYVDAMSLSMIQNPAACDVLVMENQFGDILSELGAALVGGLGLAPSAEVGENHALFQPSHGTAPQLAGKNIANPIAMILSAAMMFDWLGERNGDAGSLRLAREIEEAVTQVLQQGQTLPADLGGNAGTQDVGEAIACHLRS